MLVPGNGVPRQPLLTSDRRQSANQCRPAGGAEARGTAVQYRPACARQPRLGQMPSRLIARRGPWLKVIGCSPCPQTSSAALLAGVRSHSRGKETVVDGGTTDGTPKGSSDQLRDRDQHRTNQRPTNRSCTRSDHSERAERTDSTPVGLRAARRHTLPFQLLDTEEPRAWQTIVPRHPQRDDFRDTMTELTYDKRSHSHESSWQADRAAS